MEQLLAKLNDSGLMDESGNIILERTVMAKQVKNEEGKLVDVDIPLVQSVDVETFNGFFGTTDFTHAGLTAADGGKGYTRFFDAWKAQGII